MILKSPPILLIASGLLVTAVLVATVGLATATYSRRQTVVGQIVPEGGVIRVTSRSGGVVGSIAIAEGGAVPKGGKIAVLRRSPNMEGGDAGAAIRQQLGTEASANAADARVALDKLSAEEVELLEHRKVLGLQIAESRTRLEIIDQRLAIAQRRYADGESLVRQGVLAPRGLEERRAATLAITLERSTALSQALELKKVYDDTDRRIAALPTLMRELTAQASRATAELSQRRIAAETQENEIIVSPITGLVAALPVSPGQTVPAGGTVAIVAPGAARLQAEIYIPSRAAGFIRPGQPVSLKYEAFPYQVFGTARGRIERISTSPLSPDELSLSSGMQEPMFRAIVSLERQSLSAYGRDTMLKPGMTLSADIVTARRTLWQLLLEPLYAIGRRRP